MMRNIFLKCFNTYKSDSESSLSDSFALKHMKFSPRLFEVKLSQRVETAAYFQDTDTFVVAEGEAARCYNIHTGNPHSDRRKKEGNVALYVRLESSKVCKGRGS